MKAAVWVTLLAGGLLMAVPALAEKAKPEPKAGEEVAPTPSPDDVTVGEIRIQMNTEYAKALMDGEKLEDEYFEFEDDGHRMIIHAVKRTEEHTITLTPATASDLAGVELKILPQDWKLAPLSKTEKIWRAEKKVTFPKKKK